MVIHSAASARISLCPTLSATHPVPPFEVVGVGGSDLLRIITEPPNESPQNSVGLGRLTESAPSLTIRIVNCPFSPVLVGTLFRASSRRIWLPVDGAVTLSCPTIANRPNRNNKRQNAGANRLIGVSNIAP